MYACFKTNQVYVSKKHHSTEVVTICMLLLKRDMSAINLWVMGSTPVRVNVSGSSVVRATETAQVRILLPTMIGIAQMVEHYIDNVA